MNISFSIKRIILFLAVMFCVGMSQNLQAQVSFEHPSLKNLNISQNSASESVNNLTVSHFKVIAINNNIVELEGGLAIDISNAQNIVDGRSIEVGDKISAEGDVISDPIYSTLVKAEDFVVFKNRDVEFDGVVQQVNNDSIVILNQKILLNQNTIISNPQNLRVGQTVFAYTESLSQGFVAHRIGVLPDDDDGDTSIITNITSVNDRKLSLVGGFSANLSPEKFNLLQKLTRGNLVGTTVRMQLKGSISSKNKLKSLDASPINLDLQLAGQIQDINVAERSVSIGNTKVFLTDASFLLREGSFDRPTIEDLKVGDKATIQVFNQAGKLMVILLGVR